MGSASPRIPTGALSPKHVRRKRKTARAIEKQAKTQTTNRQALVPVVVAVVLVVDAPSSADAPVVVAPSPEPPDALQASLHVAHVGIFRLLVSDMGSFQFTHCCQQSASFPPRSLPPRHERASDSVYEFLTSSIPPDSRHEHECCTSMAPLVSGTLLYPVLPYSSTNNHRLVP